MCACTTIGGNDLPQSSSGCKRGCLSLPVSAASHVCVSKVLLADKDWLERTGGLECAAALLETVVGVGRRHSDESGRVLKVNAHHRTAVDPQCTTRTACFLAVVSGRRKPAHLSSFALFGQVVLV